MSLRRIIETNTDSVTLTPSHEEAALRGRGECLADTSLLTDISCQVYLNRIL